MSNDARLVPVRRLSQSNPIPNESQLVLFMIYTSFRCQRALHRLLEKRGLHYEWPDFIRMLEQNPELVSAARRVIRRAIAAASDFRFDLPDGVPDAFREYDTKNQMRIGHIFSRENSIILMNVLVRKIRIAHARCLKERTGNRSFPLVYASRLSDDRFLQRQLLAALFEWLDRADFDLLWDEEARQNPLPLPQ